MTVLARAIDLAVCVVLLSYALDAYRRAVQLTHLDVGRVTKPSPTRGGFSKSPVKETQGNA